MSFVQAPGAVRRLVATAPGRLEYQDECAPQVPRPGQIGVRIERTLISTGTELAKVAGLTGARNGDDWTSNPLPIGYSAAGTVVAVGSHDDPFSVGERVSLSAPHASYAVVTCVQAASLPENVTLEAGTFGTLGALALHVVRLSGVQIGDVCAVVGFGLIGQLVALTARVAGARQVVIAEHRPQRRQLAAELGFALGGPSQSFDVVFECAGTASSMNDALALVARCGRVVAAGSLREPLTIDVYRDIHAKSVALIGAHGSSQHAPSRVNRWSERENRAAALQYVSDGRLNVLDLVTDRFPAGRAIDAFQLLRAKQAGTVLLDWSGTPEVSGPE